jgi:hypothetical protein
VVEGGGLGEKRGWYIEEDTRRVKAIWVGFPNRWVRSCEVECADSFCVLCAFVDALSRPRRNNRVKQILALLQVLRIVDIDVGERMENFADLINFFSSLFLSSSFYANINPNPQLLFPSLLIPLLFPPSHPLLPLHPYPQICNSIMHVQNWHPSCSHWRWHVCGQRRQEQEVAVVAKSEFREQDKAS